MRATGKGPIFLRRQCRNQCWSMTGGQLRARKGRDNPDSRSACVMNGSCSPAEQSGECNKRDTGFLFKERVKKRARVLSAP